MQEVVRGSWSEVVLCYFCAFLKKELAASRQKQQRHLSSFSLPKSILNSDCAKRTWKRDRVFMGTLTVPGEGQLADLTCN